MSTLTIYISGADITTLNVILNAVAMIAHQKTLVWSFAVMASIWLSLSATVEISMSSLKGGNSANSLTPNVNAIFPFIFAILLTTPDLQSDVQVESILTGEVTVVSNVPMIISAIPVVGSTLADEARVYVTTAFQNANAQYPLIASATNGFVNPLKVLLAARSSISRLNGVSSDVDAVITSCFPFDSGMSKSFIINKVMNAGNTGATASESIPINGANPTPLGALLYQASQQDGYVANIHLPSDEQLILSCADAANVVADSLTTSLQSDEFSRVVQGAVNGMDQPVIAANTKVDQMTQQWQAVRNARTLNNAISVGAQQAQNEMITLLTAELTENELACLDTSSTSRVTCESALVQANEIERNNIQLAAAEVPMLKYVGNFANYLIALIIGLGPIIVMFMMFAGVNAGKCIKTVAHLIAWPLLVMNVGAEIINGMMYISISNFINGLASGGVLTQAQNVAVYKELSFQIASASHMMASLPVLMGMIFAIGESAALVNVASTTQPRNENVRDTVSPKVAEQSPVISNSGFASNTIGPDIGRTTMNGASEQISANADLLRLTSTSNEALQSTQARQRTEEEAQAFTRGLSDTVAKEVFQGNEISNTDRDAISKFFRLGHNQGVSYHENDGDADRSGNNVATHATAKAGASAQFGTGGFSWNVGGGVEGATTAQATTGQESNHGANRDDVVGRTKEAGKALDNSIEYAKTHNLGDRVVSALTSLKNKNQEYAKRLSSTESSQQTQERALSASEGLTGYAGSINSVELASAYMRNRDFSNYMLSEGMPLEKNASFANKLNTVEQQAGNDQTSRIFGNSNASHAANMFKAAVLTAQDKSLPLADRVAAQKFLTGAVSHYIGTPLSTPSNIKAPEMITDRPENKTGLENAPVAVPASSNTSPKKASTPKQHGKHSQTQHSSTPHKSNPSHKPASTAEMHKPMEKNEDKFMDEFKQPLSERDPIKAYEARKEHAKESGLGDAPQGTIKRTARVVGNAAKNLVQDNGTPNVYSYGKGQDKDNK